MTLIDAQVVILRSRGPWGSDDTNLGTMYELVNEEHGHINVHIQRPFEMAKIRNEWPAFSAQYVGETEATYDSIRQQGRLP